MAHYFEAAATLEEERDIARALPREDLVQAVLSYSWDSWNATTMGAIADREDCPLLAALFIFDLGDAAYHAEQVSAGAKGADLEMFALFKRIEARINAGGYERRAGDPLRSDTPLVDAYLAGTGEGDWALDPRIVLPALERPARPKTATPLPTPPRKRVSRAAIFWIVAPWVVFFLLFWSSVKRILFG